MFRTLLIACLLAFASALMAPVPVSSKIQMSKITMNAEGKGFGGGEATRDPEPTEIDPNDPKGKQQAIHAAESFADYLKRRGGSPQMNAPSPSTHGGKGFGGGEATRDPAPTAIDPNDPKGKQQAIHKAESFAEYLARRDGGTAEAAACPHAAAATRDEA